MTVLTAALDSAVKMPASCCPCAASLQPADCGGEPQFEEKQNTIWRFVKKIFTSQILRSRRLGSSRRKNTRDLAPLRRESFYLSTGSLEKRRPSELSVDTIITLLEELDNRVNEKIERG